LALRYAPELLSGRFGAGEHSNENVEDRLDVPQVEETLDSAANRAILALQLAMLHRIQAVEERLAKLVTDQRESETRTSLGARWPRAFSNLR
jgi:hypothetical protein